MMNTDGRDSRITCRYARRRFADLDDRAPSPFRTTVSDRDAINHHIQNCSECTLEYRLFSLQRTALDLAAAPEPIRPDEDFFVALRARMARGPETIPSKPVEESWAAALLITARQLLPAMAVLVVLIIGATLLWNQNPASGDQASLRPRDRVVFSDIYDYPAPTQDDVLETLVAVEEKENGK